MIVSGRVLKQCYLHNNMDADCKYIYIIVIYDVSTVDYCKCILLYSPLNSYLYVHWILDFKYILLLILIRHKSPRFIYGTERSLKVSWNGVDLENTTHPKCDSRQDVELQTAHTEHQDDGGYPQQPFEEIS